MNTTKVYDEIANLWKRVARHHDSIEFWCKIWIQLIRKDRIGSPEYFFVRQAIDYHDSEIDLLLMNIKELEKMVFDFTF